MIKTDRGEIAVEKIKPGIRVLTRDNGYQPVVWVGSRQLDSETLQKNPELMPVRITEGALGPSLPERDTLVSPQHRMLLGNAQIKRWFDADEVLVSAHLLTCFERIEHVEVASVTYIHFMFEQHEIVLADGAWSESYQPNDMRAGAMHEEHRRELLAIFPALAEASEDDRITARPEIGATEFHQTILSNK